MEGHRHGAVFDEEAELVPFERPIAAFEFGFATSGKVDESMTLYAVGAAVIIGLVFVCVLELGDVFEHRGGEQELVLSDTDPYL